MVGGEGADSLVDDDSEYVWTGDGGAASDGTAESETADGKVGVGSADNSGTIFGGDGVAAEFLGVRVSILAVWPSS